MPSRFFRPIPIQPLWHKAFRKKPADTPSRPAIPANTLQDKAGRRMVFLPLKGVWTDRPAPPIGLAV